MPHRRVIRLVLLPFFLLAEATYKLCDALAIALLCLSTLISRTMVAVDTCLRLSDPD